ncbi:Leucine efflux protein [Fundidesulfovibrio magnetotacticus]|uniref:Leucine efflux protein n=1 Tax=Fundidesulfovibrio magnetotacticus TaxID=2730080 RepID=A0A6V8LKM0_9BACT|nr:LysE family translocator [Fundidesulfovibrio magnetotacticus]GFK93242.1 Leucine efflux protein [Fundidesulfovibrio magnetotacticus]
MLGIHDFWLFVASGILMNIAPGPDNLYVAGRAASHGFRAGALAAFGIASGCVVHILAAALGLSAVMAASSTAFTVVKLAGAAYLVWSGLSLLLARGGGEARSVAHEDLARRKVFTQGFLTNVLNPKVALFFLAFLPQFIDQSAPGKALAFLALGFVFNLTGTAWMLCLAWSSAKAASLVRGNGRTGAWLGRATGALFVGLGVRLALSDAR